MTEADFLQAIHDEPTDAMAWLVLADWLEEDGQAERAELLRLREGLRQKVDVPNRFELERRMRRLLADGVQPVAALRRVVLAEGVFLSLSLIPPGTTLMGSPEKEANRYENESPRHAVTITKPFYMSVYPVTQGQWMALVNTNPSKRKHDEHPVTLIDWDEARGFCAELAEHMERPCRLPYEAEWELACRAGTTTAFHTGQGMAAMRRAGWCSYRGKCGSAGGTRRVGQYLPNAFGLFDMHGNVREWCLDAPRRYTAEPQIDPRGPEEGAQRVVRGGSWYYGIEDSRSACRYSRPSDYRLDYYGFRVVVPCSP